MAFLSKREFASVCSITTKDLAVYIRRTKIIVKNDQIDTNDPVNAAFLEKKKRSPGETIASGTNSSTNVSKPETTDFIPESTPLENVVPSAGQSLKESERQLKYYDTVKRRKEIEKLSIEIQKKRGEVIPSELVKPVFVQHNQSILSEFKNAADEVVLIFSKKRSLSVNEIAEVKGELVDCINSAIAKAIVASLKSVDSIVQEHTLKRGVGQKV